MQKNGRVQAHDSMITCLDAIDTNLILSAGMDTRVLRWDFRLLANSASNSIPPRCFDFITMFDGSIYLIFFSFLFCFVSLSSIS